MQIVLDPIDSHYWVIHVSMRRRVTGSEYSAFCAANRDLRIERSAEGDLVIMPPAPSQTGNQNAELSAQLHIWANRNGTGVAFDSSAGFDLPDGSNRSPDASWILKSRIEALRPEQREAYMEICPDFVVELRSSSDRLRDVQTKMEEYLACGAQLGWLIDPMERKVWVYRPNSEVEILEEPSTVTVGSLMPGFVLELDPIWNPQI
jgi:Uma2 family endonuclease